MEDSKTDIGNKWLVGRTRDSVLIGRMVNSDLTPDEALTLAAWLVAIAQPMTSIQFADVLAEVENT